MTSTTMYILLKEFIEQRCVVYVQVQLSRATGHVNECNTLIYSACVYVRIHVCARVHACMHM